jgi:hypothetical protein
MQTIQIEWWMMSWLTNSPTLNSSVSPGRKKPTNNPHSANRMPALTQSAHAPALVSSVVGSSHDGISCGIAMAASPDGNGTWPG